MPKGYLSLATLACVGLAIAISTTSATAWKRGAVQTFAVLPAGDPMVVPHRRRGTVWADEGKAAGCLMAGGFVVFMGYRPMSLSLPTKLCN